MKNFEAPCQGGWLGGYITGALALAPHLWPEAIYIGL